MKGFCPHCNEMHHVECNYEIVDFPDQMIIWIGCYENDRIDHTPVVVLDSDRVKIRDNLYRIVAAVEHMGDNLNSGHYVAYVRRGNRWGKCNDSNVTPQAHIPLGMESVSFLVLEKFIKNNVSIP